MAALARLEYDHSLLSNYTKSLEEYCLEIDLGQRKKHLILTGIPKSPDEYANNLPRPRSDPENLDNPEGVNEEADKLIQSNGTLEVALEMLTSIHDTLVYEDIELAYGIDKKKSDLPRPILIKFTRESVRNEINKKR